MRAEAARAGKLEEEVAALRAGGPALDDNGFWVPERHGQRRVPIESIDWIEAARDYVLLHTNVKGHLLRTTMAALEEKLKGTALLRVHRSAFVPPDKVVEVKRANPSLTLLPAHGAPVPDGTSYIAEIGRASCREGVCQYV